MSVGLYVAYEVDENLMKTLMGFGTSGWLQKKFEMEEVPGGLLFYRLPAGRSFGPISFDMFELRSGLSKYLTNII